MPLRPRWFFVLVLAISGACALPAAESDSAFEGADWFLENPAWAAGEGDAAGQWVYQGPVPEEMQLRTQAYIGDAYVRVSYRLPAGGDPGAKLYMQTRYPVPLGGVPGEWHTVEARVRGARYDEAGRKLERAFILDAWRDGERIMHNVVFPRQVPESEFEWENGEGPTTIAATVPGFAIQSFEVRRTDFAAIHPPAESGGDTNIGDLIDFVAMGEAAFTTIGCVECHAVVAGDPAIKTGPNLFGLFQVEPRQREIMDAEGHRFLATVDRTYLFDSIRNPMYERAIAEVPAIVPEGEPFLPAMVPYTEEIVSDQQIEALGAYLLTLNRPENQGPIERWLQETGPENYDPLADRLQWLVDDTVRIQRGPMVGVSGRAIHVGLPIGLNYSFDPRVLGIARIWQGGWLNMAGELRNRGGGGLKPGFDIREIDLGDSGVLLAPLHDNGEPVDFWFKEANYSDVATRLKSLNSPVDPLEMLAQEDAAFLGYERDSTDPNAAPVFKYRVGPNTLAVSLAVTAEGDVTVTVDGELEREQRFQLNSGTLEDAAVSTGRLRDGEWRLPRRARLPATITGRIALASDPWRPEPSTFDDLRQPLETKPATAQIPAGYTIEDYLSPRDNYGRDLLFEALGVDVAPDGTIVVATRTAGIWRIVDGEWRKFAEGLFDSLGVLVEDESGLVVVAGQKAELTRISDTNGDGLADRYDTLTDAFSYHGNYHSYLHGPVREPETGDYIITLNLAHNTDDGYFNANGQYMGTAGGYRGWAIRVPKTGGFEPIADGLRSPAGLAFAPDGRLWYADNQGEYNATSKVHLLKPGKFYGHPAGLVDRPGMMPESPEIAWDVVALSRENAIALLPQTRLANSPGNPAWDTTGGRFGPFGGDMFIGDQTQSVLMRIQTEVVNGQEQGVTIPFGHNLESGIMRPVFLPDGSLLIGQTGRGWQAKGGQVTSLQRIVWDGTTVAPALAGMHAKADGFALQFTQPLPVGLTFGDLAAALKIRSWVYRDAPDYGSPALDEHDEAIRGIVVADDRRSLHVTLNSTVQPKVHPQQTARVYHLTLDPAACWGELSAREPGLEAYYTLYEFPAE